MKVIDTKRIKNKWMIYARDAEDGSRITLDVKSFELKVDSEHQFTPMVKLKCYVGELDLRGLGIDDVQTVVDDLNGEIQIACSNGYDEESIKKGIELATSSEKFSLREKLE